MYQLYNNATMSSFNQVRNSVIGFFGKSFREWFDAHLEYKLKEHFDKVMVSDFCDCGLDEYIQDVYNDEFIEDIANSEEFSFNQFLVDNQHSYKANVFIINWIECCKWFEDSYDTKKEIISQEQAWNCIAYWIIKEHLAEDWKDLFTEKFKEEYAMYKDNKTKPSRIACGVCLENKLIYTGCSTCKGNFLCYTCYSHLESDNECPFCRCPEMILNIEPPFNQDDNTNAIFIYRVMPDLMSVLESRIIDPSV